MSFFAKLATLNPTIVYLCIVILFLGFGLALAFATRHLTCYQKRKTHNDITGYIFTTAGAIYGVLLAFITVIVWQQYNNAAENAGKEATAALGMYRNLTLYPDQEPAGKALQSLQTFMRSVVEDEYPAMTQMKRSRATTQAMDTLWVNTKKLTPKNFHEQALFNEILKDLNNIAELRMTRLGAVSDLKLSGLMRPLLIFGALVTIIFAVLFGAEDFWWHIIMVCLLSLLIATILFILEQLAHPFTSGIAIKPDDYVRVLEMIGTQ